MRYGLRSLRLRIIVVSILLVTLLLAAGWYADRKVYHVIDTTEQVAMFRAGFRHEISELKNAVSTLEGGLYRYAMAQDGAARAKVEWILKSINEQVIRMGEASLLLEEDKVRKDFRALLELQLQLDTEAHNILLIVGDLVRRFPASRLIVEELFPAGVRFHEEIDQALLAIELEVEEPLNHTLLDTLKEIRYLWSQQISTVRMFVASRSGLFGYSEQRLHQQLADRTAYIRTIQQRLVTMHGLGTARKLPVFSDAVANMEAAIADYEQTFVKIQHIDQAGNWRMDVAELRDVIQPLLSEIRKQFNILEQHLDAMDSKSALASYELAEKLSKLLWHLAFLSIFLLLAGYLVYELSVRRPINEVISALKALGQGKSYSPLMKTATYETEALLNAFREMQNQVQGREVRLVSILDNASDGIITINSRGIVETFNTAAEKLFQYSAEEMIGQKINCLMPHPVCDEHDDYIRRYLTTGEQRILSSELNVTARRKDGSHFPMAIKVSEMVLNGERYFTAIMADISERKAMLDKLRYLAEHDSLTGLYNRQYFTEELTRLVQRAQRMDCAPFALLYIDLDNFKLVNDTISHQAGDQVLIEITRLLSSHTRRTDLLARLGGDEFVVLLYGSNKKQAQQAAENFRVLLSDYVFRHQGRVLDIGCSIGMAVYDQNIISHEELMTRADIACQVAKRAGRNTVHVYETGDRENTDSMVMDMGWARRIKKALEGDGFVFAIQPIVDVSERNIVSYELLLRMRDEGGELILPGGFIPAAERFGLILELDRWVVRNAVRLLAEGGLEPSARLSINLSGMTVGDKEILASIQQLLDEYAIHPQRLTFEVTETVAMANLGSAIDFLARLRALGCRTALDDFGVGYSSFAYLKDLPADYVKLDGSFVRNITEDKVQLAMVKSMTEIAHAMGKKVVAEFVESEAVLKMLEGIGVDYAQGYYTGRPGLLAEHPDTVNSK